MTRQEALLIPDLQIEVTELVEDAFYAFRDVDDSELKKRLKELGDDYVDGDEKADELLTKYLKDLDIAEKAADRWLQSGTPYERVQALLAAEKMIENQKKYGVPCAAWCN